MEKKSSSSLIFVLFGMIVISIIYFYQNADAENIDTPKEIAVNFKDLNGDLKEEDILTQYDGVKFVCGDENSSLGDRYCYADIVRFNGMNAKMIVFFFENGTLKQMKVDFPAGDSYSKLVEKITAEYGKAQLVPKPIDNNQLIGWVIPNGQIVTSLRADSKQDMFLWIEK